MDKSKQASLIKYHSERDREIVIDAHEIEIVDTNPYVLIGVYKLVVGKRMKQINRSNVK